MIVTFYRFNLYCNSVACLYRYLYGFCNVVALLVESKFASLYMDSLCLAQACRGTCSGQSGRLCMSFLNRTLAVGYWINDICRADYHHTT